MTAAYATLETRFRRLGLVNEAVAMLNWDTAAMMPDGGAAARAEQLAELKVIAHEI
ncbi:MAG: carboxypeptidase M32, partial [Stellaceae bacterium]